MAQQGRENLIHRQHCARCKYKTKTISTIGLKIATSKTKILPNIDVVTPITFYSNPMEVVDQYIYLRHLIPLKEDTRIIKTKRRIKLAWAATESCKKEG